MRYRFKKTVKVEGVDYDAGDVIDADEIPAGCLESCLRTGFLETHEEPPPAPPPPTTPPAKVPARPDTKAAPKEPAKPKK